METALNQQAQAVFHIAEASQIAAARRGCNDLAFRLGFDETQAGRVAIVVTEAATNILKHGRDGDIVIRPLHQDGRDGVEILAIDHGAGIGNINASLVDGVSTAGSSGTGLGAMRRLSAEFDIYSQPGKGTVIYVVLWADGEKSAAQPTQLGAICLPLASEEVCGDAWHCRREDIRLTVMVADGLGHGPLAHQASQAAIEILNRQTLSSPTETIMAAHGALRATRGAAVAVAVLDLQQGRLDFAGVGNIAVHLYSDTDRRQLMSHNGIVGSNVRNVQEFSMDWSSNAILIMHSDGLQSQWDIAQYPGLQSCHPAIIAAILFRDFCRKRDDVTVVVLKQNAYA
jgi:anti-sigma regulatory factor (Ser/Thr protein kinase)